MEKMMNRQIKVDDKYTPKRITFAFIIFLSITLFGSFGWVSLLTSCTNDRVAEKRATDPVSLDTSIKKVGDVAGQTGDISNRVTSSANSIDGHTQKIVDVVPPDTKPKIDPDIKGIQKDTGDLRNAAAELIAVKRQLEDTQTELTTQKQNATENQKRADDLQIKLTSAIDDLKAQKEANAELFRKLLAVLGVICVGGMGVSAALAFLSRSTLPIFIGIGFGVSLLICVALSLYMKQIAWGVIAVMGVAVVVGIAWLIKNHKNETTATNQLVHTTEIAKHYMPAAARDYVFGTGPEGGAVDRIQNAMTKKIVSNIRSKNTDLKTKIFQNASDPSDVTVPQVGAVDQVVTVAQINPVVPAAPEAQPPAV